jgi:hypothetical protein
MLPPLATSQITNLYHLVAGAWQLFGGGNQGLLIKVLQEQARGNDGGIKGCFLILDVGNNKHSPVLCALVQRLTDAEEVLALIRRKHPGCVSVVNANILVADQD